MIVSLFNPELHAVVTFFRAREKEPNKKTKIESGRNILD